jgi:hypothetical protein
VPKSAIHIWFDHYEFLGIPFGLSCTPLLFMDLMVKCSMNTLIGDWLSVTSTG